MTTSTRAHRRLWVATTRAPALASGPSSWGLRADLRPMKEDTPWPILTSSRMASAETSRRKTAPSSPHTIRKPTPKQPTRAGLTPTAKSSCTAARASSHASAKAKPASPTFTRPASPNTGPKARTLSPQRRHPAQARSAAGLRVPGDLGHREAELRLAHGAQALGKLASGPARSGGPCPSPLTARAIRSRAPCRWRNWHRLRATL